MIPLPSPFRYVKPIDPPTNYDIRMDFPTLGPSPSRIQGDNVRLWTPSGNDWVWDGSDGPGPSNVDAIRWDGLHLRSGGIVLHNANFAKITDLSVQHAAAGFTALNRNSGGQSEHNLLSARINACDEGIVLGGGTGNPSHRGWDMHAVITHCDKPFSVGRRANVYGGRFRLHISTKSGSLAAAVCLDGNIHGAIFDVLIENPVDVGIALANKQTDGIGTQTQGFIRAHFVHSVENPGVFDGPMAELPSYSFTYGGPWNGNHTRPAWVCTDGEVFDHARW